MELGRIVVGEIPLAIADDLSNSFILTKKPGNSQSSRSA